MITAESLILQAKERGASDIHLIAGLPAKFRVDGALYNMAETPLDEEDCLRIARDLAGKDWPIYETTGELDAAGTF